MEDLDRTLASITHCIDQLCQSSSTLHEKESSLKQLMDLIDTHDNAFSVVGLTRLFLYLFRFLDQDYLKLSCMLLQYWDLSLKAESPFIVKERTIEALASLYGNAILLKKLVNSEAKCFLVGLRAMAEVKDEMEMAWFLACAYRNSKCRSVEEAEASGAILELEAAIEIKMVKAQLEDGQIIEDLNIR